MSAGSLHCIYYTDPAPGPTSVDLGQEVIRLGLGLSDGLVSSANQGSPGTGSCDFDSLSGLLSFTGLHSIYFTENDAPSGQHRLWTGIVADRTQKRGGDERPSLREGASRVESVTLIDHNEILHRRLFAPDDATANRPAETPSDRLTWLLGTSEMSLITDQGLVEYPVTPTLTAADYRKRSPSDVLADMQTRLNYMCWARHNESSGDPELVFLDPDGTTFSVAESVFSISNILTQVERDGTGKAIGPHWPPLIDAEQTISPERIFSGLIVDYTGGSVYRTRAATATAFGGWRDSTVSADWITTQPEAEAYGDHLLDVIAEEARKVTVTLKLPCANVNDAYEGHRLSGVTFSHLSGWEAGSDCRITQRTVMQNEESDAFYNVRYELSPSPPPPGGFLIAFVTASGGVPHGAMPIDLSANPWTVAYWSDDFADPTQFPGPGVDQSMGIWYRDVVADEGAGVLTMKAFTGASRCAAWVFEVAGADSATISVVSGTDTIGGNGSSSTVSAAAGASSVLFGGFALQKVSYGHGTEITPTDGTELIDANEVNTHVPLTSIDSRPPWSWIGYDTGSGTLTIGGTVVNGTGSGYNLQGRGYCALLMETPTTFAVVQQSFAGPALPGQPFTVTLPSPPTP